MNIKPNALFTNDNLFVLNGMNSECVDLIYLDPPFNSKRFYSAPIGSQAAGASFKDMWNWDDVDWALLVRLTGRHPQFVQFIQSIMGLFNDFTHYRELPDRDDYPRANPRDRQTRSLLYGNQNGRCNGCKKRFDKENLETDHIIPQKKGGGDFVDNFQLLCGRCNRIKGDRPMEYLDAFIANLANQKSIFGKPGGKRPKP